MSDIFVSLSLSLSLSFSLFLSTCTYEILKKDNLGRVHVELHPCNTSLQVKNLLFFKSTLLIQVGDVGFSKKKLFFYYFLGCISQILPPPSKYARDRSYSRHLVYFCLSGNAITMRFRSQNIHTFY